MSKPDWSSSDIQKVFRFEQRGKGIQTLFNAEKRGEIPQAKRKMRGSVKMRQWEINQIPKIGEKFGFLKPHNKQTAIAIYVPKGGVLKTGTSHNFAKIFALNNLKTLLIDLEPMQRSLTKYTIPRNVIESLEELENLPEILGLYHFFFEKAPIDNIIQKTSLPTLDIIPATPELAYLELKIGLQARREFLFNEKLMPKIKNYDVVIFDNGSNFNQLVMNAICASNNLLLPLGCDAEAYESLDVSLETVFDFINDANIKLDNTMYLPTLLENTKLSQQIYGKYLNEYKEKVIPFPIKRNVKGQDARLLNLAVIEYAPTSDLAQDYYLSAREIWGRITQNKGVC